MSKKLISILLAVLLAVPLCLAVSSDGGEIREPVFAFGGYSGAKLYGYEESASGSGWTYDAVSHILTLDGYRAIDDGALCLYNLPCDFTVYVTPGTVNILSITETDWQSAYQDGYVPKGSLRIAGSGELDCDYLECGCRLTVCGTTVVIAEDLYAGYGFSASGADITAGFADIWEGSGPVSLTDSVLAVDNMTDWARSFTVSSASSLRTDPSSFTVIDGIGNTVQLVREDSGSVYSFYSPSDRITVRASGTSVPDVTFADDRPSSWAENEVVLAIKAHLVPEHLQKNYTGPITRGDFAEMIICLIEKTSGKEIGSFMSEKGVSVSGNAFSDTSNPYVLEASALGIINGTGHGKFSPASTLKRAQIAAIINRIAAAVKGVDTAGYEHGFTDITGNYSWADAELGWPVHAGIVNGVGGGKFNPGGELTTEQAILIVYRASVSLSK